MYKASKSYDNKALEPYLSEETQTYHFEKHHIGYTNTLNDLVQKGGLPSWSLSQIISMKDKVDAKVFNNAAQIFNHDFYWNSLSLNNSAPNEKLLSLINQKFGSIENFQNSYISKASELFGSGWSWIVFDKTKLELDIVNTSNAENYAATDNLIPILVTDLWEHSYYIDYRNDRKKYVENIVKHCLNWEFANSNLCLS
ncbi:MAG: superoxide dismutase [Holosporales bacterium]|jgi:Fe-Mn family superoxide dismutase|nr:superoxide dismutase [Holosporales bacterium]